MTFFNLFLAPGGWVPMLLFGLLTTVGLAIAGMFAGAFLGGIVVFARLSKSIILRGLADGYVTILRGVPDLLIIYLFYFGGSAALTRIASWFGIDSFVGMPVFLTGVLALGVVSAAYQAEVFRGAYLAIPSGQLEAARACGMRPWRMLRRIIMPQLLRYALPGLGNVWQLILKDSALLSVTGVVELMRAAQIGAGSTRMPFYFYGVAFLLYLLVTSISGRLFTQAERRSGRAYRRA